MPDIFSKTKKPSRFVIKLMSWEYWPMHVVYIPVYAYFLLLSLRARSLFFFTSLNPGIDTGGMFGDSKIDILNLIPEDLIPKTCHLEIGIELEQASEAIAQAGIDFPMILKPNIGERGFLVEKVTDQESLEYYLDANKAAEIVVQEFAAHPEEVSVLYYRFPGENTGYVSSLTLKEFLSVTGDGIATLRQLIEDYPRAYLQKDDLEARYADRMDEVLELGEKRELVAIGNHCRGTAFIDGQEFIDEKLVSVFDKISHQLDGIYFGRFDIKCQSLEDLKEGKNFSILEINGAKAEPTHIYDSSFSLWKAYGVLFRQWNIIYKISKANQKLGVPFMTTREGFQKYFSWAKYKKEFEKKMSAE